MELILTQPESRGLIRFTKKLFETWREEHANFYGRLKLGDPGYVEVAGLDGHEESFAWITRRECMTEVERKDGKISLFFSGHRTGIRWLGKPISTWFFDEPSLFSHTSIFSPWHSGMWSWKKRKLFVYLSLGFESEPGLEPEMEQKRHFWKVDYFSSHISLFPTISTNLLSLVEIADEQTESMARFKDLVVDKKTGEVLQLSQPDTKVKK